MLISDWSSDVCSSDLERIFEMTADLMAVGKADGTLLSVNPAWSKVLGFSESELRDISFGALFSDQEASLWEQVSEELMSLRPVLDLVAPMTARDGSLRHVSWTIVPEDADKDDARIFAVGRDVTDDLLAQEKLKEAEGQIHQMKKKEDRKSCRERVWKKG